MLKRNALGSSTLFTQADGSRGKVGDAILTPADKDGVVTLSSAASTILAASAVIIDYDGDGSGSVPLSASSVLFDMNGDGVRDKTGWIVKGDALLARDLDGDGRIDGVAELPSGILGTNDDAVLDGLDSNFASYKLWFDDGDGSVDAGELLSLTEAGIAEIRLENPASLPGAIAADANPVSATGTFRRASGTTGAARAIAVGYEQGAAAAAPPAQTPSPQVPPQSAPPAETPSSQASGDPATETSRESGVPFSERGFARKASKYQLSSDGGELIVSLRKDEGAVDDRSNVLGSAAIASFAGKRVGYLSALVLDLDGDGVDLKRYKKSNARFDMDGDGTADDTGWTGKGDGFLVMDGNGDGIVSTNEELSFLKQKPGSRNSFEALGQLDKNKDGLLDSGDEKFGQLRVWTDRNGNGITDGGEFRTLAEHGIASIGLSARAVEGSAKVGHSTVLLTAVFTRADGSRGTVGDAALGFRPEQSRRHDGLAADILAKIEALRAGSERGFAERIAAADPFDLDSSAATMAARQQALSPGAGSDAGAGLAVQDRRVAQMIQAMASFGIRVGEDGRFDRNREPIHRYDFVA